MDSDGGLHFGSALTYLEGLDDVPWDHIHWDDIFAFDGQPLEQPQSSADALLTDSTCGGQAEPNDLLETPKSIQRLIQAAPLPPSNKPLPDPVGLLCNAMLDRVNGFWLPDFEERHQFFHSTGVALVSPDDIRIIIEEDSGSLKLNSNAPVPDAPCLTLRTPPQPRLEKEKAKSTASRCIPCRFAGVPKSQCDGTVGSTCTRCQNLQSKVYDKKNSPSSRPVQLLIEPNETLLLPDIMFFELAEAQQLLVALRGKVDQISQLKPGDSLESLFDSEVVCYIDDSACFSQYSTTSSVFGIKRLATTGSAAAASSAAIVDPAIEGIEPDRFISGRRPSCDIQGLSGVDHKMLTAAWNCSYWITVLLNWDANELYVGTLDAGLYRGIGIWAAKNFVLELTYWIAHRVQALIQELCYQMAKPGSKTEEHRRSPTAVCCALWIIFTATNKFEKRNLQATSLTNLRELFSKLRERSRAALHSINQHKWRVSAHCCGHARENQGGFAKLIAEAKRPKATLSFAFERHVPEALMFLHGGSDIANSGFRPQRYSEVLEAALPFLQDDSLFSAEASWSMTAPWPSDSIHQHRALGAMLGVDGDEGHGSTSYGFGLDDEQVTLTDHDTLTGHDTFTDMLCFDGTDTIL